MTCATVQIEFGVQVPLRHGGCLTGNLYRPKGSQPAPGLVALTPYGTDYLHPDARFYAGEGFATLVVDVRGRGNSPGQWVPYSEAEDGADCIAFLAASACCTGRVGLFGASYSGVLQWLIAARRPPQLGAIAPIAAPVQGVDGKTSNGIPWTYNLRWMTLTAGRAAGFAAFADEALWRDLFWRHYRSGKSYAALGHLAGLPPQAFVALAANQFEPTYWAANQVSDAELDAIDVPVLTISGLSDDCLRGALLMAARHRRSASPSAAGHQVVVGPWDHAGRRMPSPRAGERQPHDDQPDPPRAAARRIAAAFYARHLADDGQPALPSPATTVFVPGLEQWAPLDHEALRPMFLAPAGLLGAAAAPAGTATFTNDPVDDRFATLEATGAVGNTWAALCGAQPLEDGFAAHLFGAGLAFLSAPFDEAVTVLGTPAATLYVSLDVPDADLVVTLAEIEPGGQAVTLSMDLMRLRFRDGLAAPSLLEPGVHRLVFDRFRLASRRLLPGSRLRVVVRALNSIHFQRNMQSGGDLLTETAADARPARITVHFGGECASRIDVPLRTERA